METQKLDGGWHRLAVTDPANTLRRKGADGYPVMRTVLTTDPAQWEEAAPAAYARAEYDAEVERLVAERYTLGQEIQVNREAAERPGEFAAYMAYLADCKARARENLEAGVRDQALGVRN